MEVYENVAIKSIAIDKDSSNDALAFSVTFQEFPIVQLKQVEIEASVKPKSMGTDLDKQSAKPLNQGTQTGI